jgi:hypothetical protein
MPTSAYPTPPPYWLPPLRIRTHSEFLEEIKGLFDNITNYWDQILFKESFRDSIRKAWDETKRYIGVIQIGPDKEEDRRREGLEGEQWKLKLDIINDIWSRFRSRGLPSLLQDLLEIAGSVVESLAKVYPALGALKEIIDSVRWLIGQNEKLTGHEATANQTP